MTEQKELPQIDFTTFVLSLASSVQIQLGLVPDPTTQKTIKNFAMAKQTIDLLDILKEKTKGNLNEQEEKLFGDLLYSIRMQYVSMTKGGTSTDPAETPQAKVEDK
jgi:hypothetical protein